MPVAAGAGSAAQQGQAAGGPKKSIQVVEFVLGGEHFAIDLFDVKEVVEYTSITKLPNVPPFVRGVIDLRGEITVIIDPKLRLSITDDRRLSQEASRIIVLDERITNAKVGILVDDVTSVSTFGADQVDHNSAAITGNNSTVIGIIKRKVNLKGKEINELIIWIDVRQILEGIDIAAMKA